MDLSVTHAVQALSSLANGAVGTVALRYVTDGGLYVLLSILAYQARLMNVILRRSAREKLPGANASKTQAQQRGGESTDATVDIKPYAFIPALSAVSQLVASFPSGDGGGIGVTAAATATLLAHAAMLVASKVR
jgi:hypothetical protein